MHQRFPTEAPSYGIVMPDMSTLFVIVDKPDELSMCGIKEGDGEEYCSCIPRNPDPRRCRHLWAMEFFLERQRRSPQPNLEVRYPGVRSPIRRANTTPLQIDPLADPEGLCIFLLLAKSTVWLDLFDRFTSTSPLFYALRDFFKNVSVGKHVDYQAISSAYKGERALGWFVTDSTGHPLLSGQLYQYDAGDVLHSMLEHFDFLTKQDHFTHLFKWTAQVTATCDNCKAGHTNPDEKVGWKKLAIPRTRSSSTMASIFDLVQSSEVAYKRMRCNGCGYDTFHNITQSQTSCGKLLLIEVIPIPRPEPVKPFSIPPSVTDSHGVHRELVGFLCNASGSIEGNYTAVIYHMGRLVEFNGHDETPWTFRGQPSRRPVLILYQQAAEGQSRECNWRLLYLVQN